MTRHATVHQLRDAIVNLPNSWCLHTDERGLSMVTHHPDRIEVHGFIDLGAADSLSWAYQRFTPPHPPHVHHVPECDQRRFAYQRAKERSRLSLAIDRGHRLLDEQALDREFRLWTDFCLATCRADEP